MKKIFLILIGILLIGGIGFLILSSRKEKPKKEEIKVETKTQQVNLAFSKEQAIKMSKNEFSFALKKVEEDWDKDAQLIAVVITYENSVSDPISGKDTYVFKSKKKGPFPFYRYFYTVTFDQAPDAKGNNRWQRAIIPVEDYFLDLNLAPIPFKYWNTDFISALKKAEENGGSEFRENHQKYEVKLVLSQVLGEYLTWKITYKAKDKTFDKKEFEIDANTGEFYLGVK